MKKLLFILLLLPLFAKTQTAVFCCGGECGVSAATGHWGTLGTGWSFSTAIFRSGTTSMRYNPSAANATITGVGGTSGTTKVWRNAIYFTTLPSADCIISWFDYSGSSAGIGFKQSDSKIYSAVEIAGVNTFGATGVSVTTGVWYYIDVKAVGSVVTGTCDVQVNGSACAQATGAFAGANSTNINRGSNGVNISADIYYEDLFVSETGGNYPIGNGYIMPAIPMRDGTHNVASTNDFERTLTGTDIDNNTTDAWVLVSTIPLQSGGVTAGATFVNMVLPPNATDYVECIFGTPAGLYAPSVAPKAVEVIMTIGQFGTGTGNMEIRINDNGTTNAAYTATTVAGVTTLAYKRKMYAVNIADGGAWVIGGGGNGDFTDLRVRFGSPAAVDANPDQYFSSIMIEAAYSGAPPVYSRFFTVF